MPGCPLRPEKAPRRPPSSVVHPDLIGGIVAPPQRGVDRLVSDGELLHELRGEARTKSESELRSSPQLEGDLDLVLVGREQEGSGGSDLEDVTSVKVEDLASSASHHAMILPPPLPSCQGGQERQRMSILQKHDRLELVEQVRALHAEINFASRDEIDSSEPADAQLAVGAACSLVSGSVVGVGSLALRGARRGGARGGGSAVRASTLRARCGGRRMVAVGVIHHVYMVPCPREPCQGSSARVSAPRERQVCWHTTLSATPFRPPCGGSQGES